MTSQFGTQVKKCLQFHDVRTYLTACMAMATFFSLQAQAIAGFSSCGEAACYPEILRISYNFVQGNICNYELLYNVKAHVPTHTEGRNGSSDLVDLGTFRLIRRSSEEFTWPGVPLALQTGFLPQRGHPP